MWDFLRCYLFINLKLKRLLKYRCQLLQRNREIGRDSSNMLRDFHFHLWRRYFVGAFRKFCPAGHPCYIHFFCLISLHCQKPPSAKADSNWKRGGVGYWLFVFRNGMFMAYHDVDTCSASELSTVPDFMKRFQCHEKSSTWAVETLIFHA